MPDGHIGLHTVSTVPLRHDSVYDVQRMHARRLDPLLVSTDLAEAEHVQMAFFEAFSKDAAKVFYVNWFPQRFLCDADIEAAHIQIYCAHHASSGLRCAAAGERSAAGSCSVPHLLEPENVEPKRLRMMVVMMMMVMMMMSPTCILIITIIVTIITIIIILIITIIVTIIVILIIIRSRFGSSSRLKSEGA